MSTSWDLPLLPVTPSREGIFPGPHGYSNKDMWNYGIASWNAALEAAVGAVKGDDAKAAIRALRMPSEDLKR